MSMSLELSITYLDNRATLKIDFSKKKTGLNID